MVDVSIWFLIVTFFVTFFIGIILETTSFVSVFMKMILYIVAGFCVYYLWIGKL